MKRKIFAIWIVGLLIGLNANAQSNPLTCTNPHSPFSDEVVFARYEQSAGRLVIISWNTGTVLQELATNSLWNNFYILDWSPDCGNLITEIDGNTVLWDVISSRQVGSMATHISRETSFPQRLRINWSPNSESVLLQTPSGAYLWNLNTYTYVQLTAQSDGNQRSLVSGSWNLLDNQVFVVQIDRANGVSVYDLNSLEMTDFYHMDNRRQPARYGYTEDTMLLYSSVRAWGFPRISSPGLSVWNTQTQAGIQLDPNDPMFSLRDGYDFENNPDYFVVNARGYRSSNKLYFWNRNHLIGAEPYVPNFTVNATVDSFRVINSTTLEVVDWRHLAYSYEPVTVKVYQIDINDGRILDQTPWLSYAVACKGIYSVEFESLLDWACENATYEEPKYWGISETFIWAN